MIFTIDNDNNITAHASPEDAAAVSTSACDSFAAENQLTQLIAGWPDERLLALWNSLPGVAPVQRFRNRNVVARRIWERVQKLGKLPRRPRSRSQQKRSAVAHKPPKSGRRRSRQVRRPPSRGTRTKPERPRSSRTALGRARAARPLR